MNITDICNLALSYIGKGVISDVEADSENARACKRHYDHRRRQLLRDFSWGFAQASTKLAQLDASFPGWDYVYAYPAKCLSVRSLYNAEGENIKEWESNKYKIIMVSEEVKAICCNISEAYIDYTYDNKQAEVYTPDFIEALARGLAADMAIALTGSSEIMQTQTQYMQYALQKAMLTSAAERRPSEEYPTRYYDARA